MKDLEILPSLLEKRLIHVIHWTLTNLPPVLMFLGDLNHLKLDLSLVMNQYRVDL